MTRTRVKVCGIIREEDATAACAAGADALGFVFWPRSPRAVDVPTAASLVRLLPPFVTPVGVFVNQPADEINAIVARVGLRVVQLHGDEPVEMSARISVPVVKTLGIGDDDVAEVIVRWPPTVMPLLDAADPDRRGGTGRTIDWRVAASISRARPIILAGGLRPDNVEEAVRVVRPFTVDVSSGVEASPGVKDADRIRAFVAAVRRADARQEL